MSKPYDVRPGLTPRMRRYVYGAVVLVAVIGLGVFTAKADTIQTTSEATSSSSASVTANSGSQSVSQGGSVYIAANPSQTRSVVENRQSGTYTVRSAPAVQAPSMGSGHPCAMSGSVGISIIGGGVSGGTMKIDEACLLAQMGQGEAALIMIARRDSEACLALRAVGRIPASSQCTSTEKRAKPVAVTRPVASSIPTCPVGARWDGKGCWMPKKNRR